MQTSPSTDNKSCNEYIWQEQAKDLREPKKCYTLLGVGGVNRFTLLESKRKKNSSKNVENQPGPAP